MRIYRSANSGKVRSRIALLAQAFFLLFLASAIVFALSYESDWPLSIGDAVHSSPAVEDIDGSGKRIVVSTADGYTHVLNANGIEASGWPARAEWTSGTNVLKIENPRAPAIADLDGDGKKEIIVSSDWSSTHKPQGQLSLFRSNGSLVWRYAFSDYITLEASPVIADLTGEGEPEIIVGTADKYFASNNLYIFHQNQSILRTIALPGKMYATPAVADLDGDGKVELLVATTDGTLALYKADGSQAWSTSIGVEYSSPAIGDIDFDGDLEIVVGAVGGLYALDGNGQILPGWPNTNVKKASSPALGDLDGDGDLEIVAGTYAIGPDNKVFALQGEGTVIAGWPYQLPYTPLYTERVTSSPAIGDVDGDGEAEVVVATTASGSGVSGKLIVFNKGGAIESSTTLGGVYVGPASSSPSISDVDGDGKAEIVVGSPDGKMHLLEGGGLGYVGWPMFHYNARRTGVYEQPLLRVLSPSNGSTFNQNDAVQFTAQARTLSGVVPTYSWTSNRDGVLGATSNFAKAGLTVGTHVITVTASDASGRSTSYLRSIQVLNSPPTANVTAPANGSKFETNQPVSFGCTGSDPYGSITKYEWDFEGDGVYDYSSAASGSTSHSYAQSGSYAAWCRVTDNNGGVGTADVFIKVNAPPTVSISLPTNNSIFTAGDAVSLVGVAVDSDGSIALYEWDFESEGVYDYSSATSGTTTHTYTTAGSRAARFRATDNDGSSATAQVTLRINDPPIAMINLPHSGDEFKFGKVVSFEGSAFDSDGSIVSYLWNSSRDGVLSTSASFNRSNLSIGTHAITFIATDNNGASDSDSVSITIKSLGSPTATIVKPLEWSEFSARDVVSFVGSGSDVDGFVVSYNWTSSLDGLLSTSAAFNTSSLSVDDHVIILTVRDDDGLTGSARVNVAIKPLIAPTATIVKPLDGSEFSARDVVSFVGGGSDVDGFVVSYNWTSSLDGVLSTSASFNKSNLSIGTHVIKFIVADDDGLTGSANITVVIKPLGAPSATVVKPLDGSEFSARDVVSFVGGGSDVDGFVVSYNWTSSLDGLLSTSAVFNTSSLSIGDHVITLMVRDDDGLTGSARIRVEIKTQLVAPPAGGGGGGGGGAPPRAPPIERIKSAQDLIAGNRRFFSTSEIYLATPQLAGVLGSLGLVPIPKDEAKAINKLTGGRVRALQGDPYEIASELLLKKYAMLDRAIVSRGDLEVDSLAGLVYARHLGIPLLIVEPNDIPPAMRRALNTLGVRSTVVLGGPVAVSNSVADELRQMDRLAGGDRYETAVRIAETLMARRAIDTVVITDGASPNADAVVAAMFYNAPILYAKGDEIPAVTLEFLRRNRSLNIKAVGVTDAAFAKLSALFSGR